MIEQSSLRGGLKLVSSRLLLVMDDGEGQVLINHKLFGYKSVMVSFITVSVYTSLVSTNLPLLVLYLLIVFTGFVLITLADFLITPLS